MMCKLALCTCAGTRSKRGAVTVDWSIGVDLGLVALLARYANRWGPSPSQLLPQSVKAARITYTLTGQGSGSFSDVAFIISGTGDTENVTHLVAS